MPFVSLYSAAVLSDAALARAYAKLHPDRLRVLDAMGSAQARARSMTADLLLRAAVISVRPDTPLPLRRAAGPYGKPFLPDCPGLHLSLSHSRNQVLCALSDVPVGVDLELPRPVRPGLAARFFTPEEQAELQAHPDAFFDLWMCKEAVVKCTGQGLTLPLSAFSVALYPTPHLTRLPGAEPLSLSLLSLPGVGRAAVCTQTAEPVSILLPPCPPSIL